MYTVCYRWVDARPLCKPQLFRNKGLDVYILMVVFSCSRTTHYCNQVLRRTSLPPLQGWVVYYFVQVLFTLKIKVTNVYRANTCLSCLCAFGVMCCFVAPSWDRPQRRVFDVVHDSSSCVQVFTTFQMSYDHSCLFRACLYLLNCTLVCPPFFFHRTWSRFDLVWFRLSCDHGWIRSGSVNVRWTTT